MSSGTAQNHSGAARARCVNAPITASTAKIQKQITPVIAAVRPALIVDAVWIDQSIPPRSSIRRVVQNATLPTYAGCSLMNSSDAVAQLLLQHRLVGLADAG